MKKVHLFMALLTIGLVVSVAGVVQAQELPMQPDLKSDPGVDPGAAYYTCTVVSAGPYYNGAVYVGLNGTFGQNLFTAYPQAQKEMLATALSAIAAGKKVYALLQGNYVYCILMIN